MVIIICMFISSCSQEDSNPMFETNSETHINNLESKAKFIRCKAIVRHILLYQKLLKAEPPQHLG